MSCGKWFHPCNCNCKELGLRTWVGGSGYGMPAIPPMGWCCKCYCIPCKCLERFLDEMGINHNKVEKRLEELEKHLEKKENKSKAMPLTHDQKVDVCQLISRELNKQRCKANMYEDVWLCDFASALKQRIHEEL